MIWVFLDDSNAPSSLPAVGWAAGDDSPWDGAAPSSLNSHFVLLSEHLTAPARSALTPLHVRSHIFHGFPGGLELPGEAGSL